MLSDLRREWWFFRRDRQAVAPVVARGLVTILALGIGLRDIATQHAEIASLEASTEADLKATLPAQLDPGSAAYYGFRLVYDAPHELAFAARGVRDELPWKHRLRILALEGQIYEHDSGNPELAQAGRIDFAFLVSVLAPLLIILLLHDVVDNERRASRLDLLTVTAGNAAPIRLRAGVRILAMVIALLLPFIVATLWLGASVAQVAQFSLITIAYVVFWGSVSIWIAGRTAAAATTATVLLGFWVTLVLLVPSIAAALAESRITAPQGGEILLQQREVVNRAWDLPEEDTMEAFFATHPEWSSHKATADGFDWSWYYAFQQVGDQSVASESQQLREAVRERDAFMAAAAWLSPPLLVDRMFSRLANTDMQAFQRYERCARDYHEHLRKAHYPMLFEAEPFDVDKLLALENVRECS